MASTGPVQKLAIDGGSPVRTEPFKRPWIFDDEERRHLMEVIDNAQAQRWGSDFKVKALTDAYEKKHGVEFAIATDSGSGAIHSAVAALNLEPGDEVITTPTTDIGGVQGIVLQNLVPVFADWDPDTFNTDPADIESRITDRTGGIIVTHLFGNPCDMDEIMATARQHNLPVIEDCAQAHLARYQGRLVGTIGDIGCFSLGGKTLTTGGGGMIITDNKELAARAIGHARKGAEVDMETRSSLAPTSYRRGSPGGYAFLGDYHKMSDLQAAVGLAQFERYDQYTESRRRAAAILDEELYELAGLTIQLVRPGNEHTYYVYGYKIDEYEMGISPIEFWRAVRAEGIEIAEGPYLRGTPLYKYPIFADAQTYGTSGYPFVDEQGRKRIDYNEVHLPVVERELPKTGFVLFRSTFSEQDVRDIAAAMRKVALHYAARRQ